MNFVAGTWSWACEPLLFAVIGTVLDFYLVDLSILPTSVFIILVCVFGVRVPAAILATGRWGNPCSKSFWSRRTSGSSPSPSAKARMRDI